MTVLDCAKCGGPSSSSKDGVRCGYCEAVLPIREARGARTTALEAQCQDDCKATFLVPNYDPSSSLRDLDCPVCSGKLSISAHPEVAAPALLADFAIGNKEIASVVARLLIEAHEVPADIFASMDQFRVTKILLNGVLHTGVARTSGAADIGYKEQQTRLRVGVASRRLR